MKITFDTSAFWDTGMTYEETYHKVAEAGYHYISPYNADFPGFWKRPKATNEEVKWHKKAIEKEGLEIASLTTGFRIQHPDEFMREYAIDCWKRMIEIAEIMEVKVFNTELGCGRDDPELREAKLMRSLDVLVPLLESKGMRLHAHHIYSQMTLCLNWRYLWRWEPPATTIPRRSLPPTKILLHTFKKNMVCISMRYL